MTDSTCFLDANIFLNTPNLIVFEAAVFARAVEYYSTSSLDLADCFVAALSEETGSMLVSYDRDFKKIEGLLTLEPGEVV